MYVPYQSLPDHARVWIYQSSRKFSTQEQEEISTMSKAFVNQWTRHGENVHGSFTLLHEQFLIIAVDQSFVEVSGCSIDASVKLIQEIQKHYDVDMLNKLAIAYKDKEEIKVVSILEFTQLVKLGTIHKETIVFNNMVDSKNDVETLWEIPASQSWHTRFFN
jgi:hypothetical protein